MVKDSKEVIRKLEKEESEEKKRRGELEKKISNCYLVLHTKIYQEGFSSNYAIVRESKIRVFKSESRRKEFMIDMEQYGNDEYDNGNDYFEMTLDKILQYLECDDFVDFFHSPIFGKVVEHD